MNKKPAKLTQLARLTAKLGLGLRLGHGHAWIGRHSTLQGVWNWIDVTDASLHQVVAWVRKAH